MKKSHEIKQGQLGTALGTLALAATLLTPAWAEDAPTTPFTMTVFSDQAYGKKVVSGKYGQVIKKITAGGHRARDKFASNNNLCVAYAKNRDIDKAVVACDAAIAQIRKREHRISKIPRSAEALVYRSNLAVALSNRGVLRAVSGDIELAEADFRAAINLQTDQASIFESNLVRLQQKAKT